MEKMAADYENIMVEGGNAFTLPYVDVVTNMSLESSQYVKASESIPFMGMVLHGYTEFTGTPINLDGDYDYSVLKAIENGAIVDAQALIDARIIKKAYEHGNIVVVCSQCPTGTVSLGHYAASSPLKKAGAVSGKNMTTEAAVAKLYYLLSCGYSKEKVKELMEKDLCGQLDE